MIGANRIIAKFSVFVPDLGCCADFYICSRSGGGSFGVQAKVEEAATSLVLEVGEVEAPDFRCRLQAHFDTFRHVDVDTLRRALLAEGLLLALLQDQAWRFYRAVSTALADVGETAPDGVPAHRSGDDEALIAALEAQFGLTPAEARVGLGIARGRTAKQVAVNSGRSYNTVRVQLRACCRKLKCKRQLELASKLIGVASGRILQ